MVTNSGATCRGFAIRGSPYCSLHHPANIKRVNEGRRRGGRKPRATILAKDLQEIKTLGDLVPFLNKLIADTYVGRIGPKQSQAICTALSGVRTTILDMLDRPMPRQPYDGHLSLCTDEELDILETISLRLEARRQGMAEPPLLLLEESRDVGTREAISAEAGQADGVIEAEEIEGEGKPPSAIMLDINNVDRMDASKPATIRAVKVSGDKWNVVRADGGHILVDGLSEKDAREVARALSSSSEELPQPTVKKEAKVYL
jgi:hypothetical protein